MSTSVIHFDSRVQMDRTSWTQDWACMGPMPEVLQGRAGKAGNKVQGEVQGIVRLVGCRQNKFNDGHGAVRPLAGFVQLFPK